MNTKLLLLVISAAAFSSCSTLYKSGQTPDDVYYSPERTYGQDEVRNEVRKEEEKQYRNEERRYNNNVRNYDRDDRSIRLGINDRRWRNFDNDYSYNPYNYGFNYGYYYNPYFWPYPVFSPVFIAPSNPKITTPRVANLGGYTSGYNNTNISAPANPKTGGGRPTRQYNNSNNNSNNGSAVGNVIRKVFLPETNTNNNNSNNNSNNNNNSSSNNNRTYTPAPSNNNSSNSSSGSSSSSGSGAVSRPARGGGN